MHVSIQYRLERSTFGVVHKTSNSSPVGMSADPKIIDILNKHTGDKSLVSLEYFPPRTDEGVKVGLCPRQWNIGKHAADGRSFLTGCFTFLKTNRISMLVWNE